SRRGSSPTHSATTHDPIFKQRFGRVALTVLPRAGGSSRVGKGTAAPCGLADRRIVHQSGHARRPHTGGHPPLPGGVPVRSQGDRNSALAVAAHPAPLRPAPEATSAGAALPRNLVERGCAAAGSH